MSNSGIMLKMKVLIKTTNGKNTIAKTQSFDFPVESSYAARRIVVRKFIDFLFSKQLYTVQEAFIDILTFDLKRIGKDSAFEITTDGDNVRFSKKGEKPSDRTSSSSS